MIVQITIDQIMIVQITVDQIFLIKIIFWMQQLIEKIQTVVIGTFN